MPAKDVSQETSELAITSAPQQLDTFAKKTRPALPSEARPENISAESKKEGIGSNSIQQNLKEIAALEQQLVAKDDEINRLNMALEAMKNKDKLAEVEDKSLKTISMEDFESQVQDQFVNRFKGIAIKVSGEQLKGIEEEFNREQQKADWNAEYETNISNYIQKLDPNGMHFVDELTCNRRMCRLSVNSSDTDGWQKLYLSMTEQQWYRSMTLTEATDNPNQMVYYITQPSKNRQ